MITPILTIGNWVFFPIEEEFDPVVKTERKYLASSSYGEVSLRQIYTISEIKAKWPDIKEHYGITLRF